MLNSAILRGNRREEEIELLSARNDKSAVSSRHSTASQEQLLGRTGESRDNFHFGEQSVTLYLQKAAFLRLVQNQKQ